jgi:exopolysaccharide biosynthesis WecB/TagA/CpsF family protein
VTPNVDHIIKLQKDEEFQQIYRDASLVLADGMPLLWAAKFLGTPLKEKISGSDLFPKLCTVAAEKGYKVFFLGGRQGAAQKAAEALKMKHNALQVVRCYSPAFGFENSENENKKIVGMIKEARPDILFVGLGAPKQEKWIYKYRNQYQVPVSIGIGVSFEFVAGMVKRAPFCMQKIGLEWFWRLMMEPKRLWKRYLVDDLKFFGLVFKQKNCS